LLTEPDVRALLLHARKLGNIHGPGVSHRPDSIAIAPPAGRTKRVSGGQTQSVFPVRLVVASGENGDDSTAPNWQYDLYPIDSDTGAGDPIAESKTPVKPRAKGIHLQPDPLIGLAYRDADGIQLMDAMEVIDTDPDPCDTP
jgi:hypothetical protein